MLTVACWKWTPFHGYRSEFSAETVNVLKRMVARHYARPHEFVCLTDDPVGIDGGIRIVPLWDDYASLPSPHGGNNPSCYRRLKAFAPEIAAVLGRRFVSLDLDCVITGDVTPLWDRPEDFVMWGDTNPKTHYNGSMLLMTAGARPQVWERFDPQVSPLQSKAAGFHGSDQGWISYCLGKGEATWSTADGVYSFRNHLAQAPQRLPADARIVMFHGRHDPWSPAVQRLGWVQEHWC